MSMKKLTPVFTTHLWLSQIGKFRGEHSNTPVEKTMPIQQSNNPMSL